MNREEIINAFEEYVSSYDLSDPKTKLKYIHTKKVADNCEEIAKSLNLSCNDQALAWEIGMLHDIGRFEQLRRYNTFIDSLSIDHAVFGADLLFKDDLIKNFDRDITRYNILEKAIRYHNCYELPDNLTDKELLFCNIIRDGDKVDIYRANYETGMEDIYNTTTKALKTSDISPEVFKAFSEGHTVLRSLNKTILDNLVGHLSLYYGLVFPRSKEMAVEQGYLWKLANFHSDNPDTEAIMEMIRKDHKDEWCIP